MQVACHSGTGSQEIENLGLFLTPIKQVGLFYPTLAAIWQPMWVNNNPFGFPRVSAINLPAITGASIDELTLVQAVLLHQFAEGAAFLAAQARGSRYVAMTFGKCILYK